MGAAFAERGGETCLVYLHKNGVFADGLGFFDEYLIDHAAVDRLDHLGPGGGDGLAAAGDDFVHPRDGHPEQQREEGGEHDIDDGLSLERPLLRFGPGGVAGPISGAPRVFFN
ncbi:hypothetical protein SDC9_90247 [bioreactor metagenome]|uniref:Uncharacterized protein n=1 Tax=bioreactor metagenome TaxID=1076179 RepID=A0A644ZRH9_9ZZZZ